MTISAVTPDSVERGDELVISAYGLGAANVRVTIGGVEAAVVSATGWYVVVRVPVDAPSGRVAVVVTNPGGQTAAGEVTVGWDGDLTSVLDTANASSATVGRSGGRIEAGGMVFDVPVDALVDDVTITMTPILSIGPAPFDDAFIAGARFEPEGLHFLQPVSLRMPTPDVPVVAATGDGDGTDVSLIPHAFSDEHVVVSFSHFTLVVLAEARQQLLDIASERILSLGEDLALQRLAQARFEFADDPDQFAQAAEAAMVIWYDDIVRGLEVGAQNLGFLEVALSDWNAWVVNLELLNLSDEFAAERGHANVLVVDSVAAVARRLLEECDGTDPANSLGPIVRLAITVAILNIDISSELEVPGDLASRFLPADLISGCTSIRITDVSHPAVLARGIDNPVSLTAVLDSWNGPSRDDLLLRFRRLESTGEGLAVVESSVQHGPWQTSVRPPSSPDVTKFPLDFEVTLPSDELALVVTGVDFHELVPVSDRIELLVRRQGDVPYDESIGTVRPNETIELAVRLAGPDLDARAVSYSFVGRGGDLSAAAGITDALGHAVFTFTAPAEGGEITIGVDEQYAGKTFSDSLTFNVSDPLIVTVTPAQASIGPGDVVQFFASVDGPAVTGLVVWSASGGSISPSGLYTAGDVPGSYSVTAVSVDDADAVGISIIDIRVEQVVAPGVYFGESTDSRFPNAINPLKPVRIVVTELGDRYRVNFGFGWREDLGTAAQTRTYDVSLDGAVLSGAQLPSGDPAEPFDDMKFSATIIGDQMTGTAHYWVPESFNPNCPPEGCRWDFVVTRSP